MSHKRRAFTYLSSPTLKLNGAWLCSLASFFTHGKCFSQRSVRSISGMAAEGYFFNRPLNESSLVDKLFELEDFSLKAGAGIMGVDAPEGLILSKWEAARAKLKIPVTTGKALVAWSAYESIYRMSRMKHIEFKDTQVAVVGVSDAAAILCCRKMCGVVKRVSIFDEDKDKLKRIGYLDQRSEIVIADTVSAAVRGADIVVASGNRQEESLCLDAVNPGGIICHIFNPGMPIQRKTSLRRGCSVLSAGFIKLPGHNNLRLIKGLPLNIVFASMAETMLLALENRLTNYSCSEDTNVEKLEEIADIAARHGFEVWIPEAPLYF